MSILVGDSGHEKAFTFFFVPNLFIGSVLHTDQTTNYERELLISKGTSVALVCVQYIMGRNTIPFGYGCN